MLLFLKEGELKPSLEEEFATALINKGFALNKLSRCEEAIAVLLMN
jgi:hypothetical protein